jgi:hypothetical protein
VVRRRGRRASDRVEYPSIGVLADPTSVERLALGIATMTVGELTERERRIAVELAHTFSSWLLDMREANDDLTERLLEIIRVYGV